MTKSRQFLATWAGIITNSRLVVVAAFCAPLITIVSSPAFMVYLALMAMALAAPLWLAIYDPKSQFSSTHLPDKNRVLFWIKWVAVIGALFVIGNINAADLADSLNRTLHVFSAFAVIAIFASGIKVLDSNKQQTIFQALLWGVIVAGIILTLVGLMYQFWMPIWQAIGLQLPPSSYFNRALVVLVFLSALAIWHAVSMGQKKLSFVAAGLVLTATILSSSESAKLVLLIFAFIGVLTWKLGKRAIWCFGTVSIVWIWVQLWATQYLHNLALSNNWMRDNWNVSAPLWTSLSRLEIWAATSDRIMERPVFGWGLDGIKHHGLPSLKNVFFGGDYVHHPHNGPLHAWVDFGIAGPILITAALVMICKFLAGTNVYHRPFLTSLVFSAIGIIFVAHGLWETWWIGLLGYVFGIASIRNNDEYIT